MNILCVCTGNTCRSPMLATLLRQALADRKRDDVTVLSAGTGAADGEPASPGAQRAMERRNLDLSGHRSQHIADVDLSRIDLVLCMTSSHAAAIRSLGMPPQVIQVINADHGGVPDPFGGNDRLYEACALALEQAARAIASSI